MINELEKHTGSIETTTNEEPQKGRRNVLERVGNWMTLEDKDKWLDQMRGNLSLVATVIATMTFQMALNPPGGILSVKDDPNPSNAKANSPSPNNAHNYPLDCGNIRGGPYLDLCPGEAVLAVVYPNDYFKFLVSNSICFVATISVCLLLVSGIRLNHRFPMWMLSLGMCITLTSLAVSYIIALLMTTPDLAGYRSYKFLVILFIAWIGLIVIIGLWHILRLVIFGVKFFRKRGNKKAKAKKTTKEIPVC